MNEHRIFSQKVEKMKAVNWGSVLLTQWLRMQGSCVRVTQVRMLLEENEIKIEIKMPYSYFTNTLVALMTCSTDY